MPQTSLPPVETAAAASSLADAFTVSLEGIVDATTALAKPSYALVRVSSTGAALPPGDTATEAGGDLLVFVWVKLPQQAAVSYKLVVNGLRLPSGAVDGRRASFRLTTPLLYPFQSGNAAAPPEVVDVALLVKRDVTPAEPRPARAMTGVALDAIPGASKRTG